MNQRPAHSILFSTLLGMALSATLPVQAATWIYEGHLDDRGVPANGRYDILLAVYRDAEFGATLVAPITFDAVEVADGRFRLDFEVPLKSGETAWVELALRDAGVGAFSVIPGRTKATQAPAAIGACWSTVGDSGSNPATHFLGTTDAQPLVLRTHNARSLRIEPSSVLSGGVPITTNTIAGSYGNSVDAGVRGATIAGGGLPGDVDPDYVAGAPNRVTSHYGAVGGGFRNQAGSSDGSLTSGGYASVAGGALNTATGLGSSVGGGANNSAPGIVATVAGGASNSARGYFSMVAGGRLNCAGGNASWAGGANAKVRPGADPNDGSHCDGLPSYPGGAGDEGSFIWADSQDADFITSGPDQFAIRARGGLRWGGTGTNSTTSPAFIHQTIIGTNTCDGGSGANSRTWINHPLLNNNPNAVIVLTPNFGSTAGGGVAPPRNPIGLYYNAATAVGCPAGRWVVYQLTVTAETLLNGARFNAWFVLP